MNPTTYINTLQLFIQHLYPLVTFECFVGLIVKIMNALSTVLECYALRIIIIIIIIIICINMCTRLYRYVCQETYSNEAKVSSFFNR